MRSVIEVDDNHEVLLIHYVTSTSTKTHEGWNIVITRCGETLSTESPMRLSRKKPTCVRCIAFVPGWVVLEMPSFDIRQR